MVNRGRRDRWQELVAKQASSGLRIAEFCRQNDVSTASFYQWRKKLRQARAAAFVPISLAGTETVRVEFPCGVVMQLPAGDDRSLVQLVSLLMPGPEKPL